MKYACAVSQLTNCFRVLEINFLRQTAGSYCGSICHGAPLSLGTNCVLLLPHRNNPDTRPESTSSTCWTTFPPSSLELTTCSWPLTHHCPCREDTTSVISQVYWLSRREAPAILCSKCQGFWEPSHLSMHIKQHGQLGEGTGRHGGEANVEARRCGLGSRLSYLLAVKTELIIEP